MHESRQVHSARLPGLRRCAGSPAVPVKTAGRRRACWHIRQTGQLPWLCLFPAQSILETSTFTVYMRLVACLPAVVGSCRDKHLTGEGCLATFATLQSMMHDTLEKTLLKCT